MTKTYKTNKRLTKLRSEPSSTAPTELLEIQNVYHLPVMKTECCDYLNIIRGGIYVDCTLGAGGHTKEIISRGGHVIGLDQDPDAIAKAHDQLSVHVAAGEVEIIQSNFRDIRKAISNSKLAAGRPVDGVLMDLGVSSYQIDEPSRGFSFSRDGPLDMRMNQGVVKQDSQTMSPTSNNSNSACAFTSSGGMTALRIINEYDVTALADIFYQYGDEQRSRQIAREVVCCRPLQTTGDLDRVISRITSFKDRSKTLAKCFQALRIAVNDELGALDEALASMQTIIRPGGRLVILSYHSLEDRRVKTLFRLGGGGDDDHDNNLAAGAEGGVQQRFVDTSRRATSASSRLIALYEEDRRKINNPWRMITKGAVKPSSEEVAVNSRSRSAKLRVAERL